VIVGVDVCLPGNVRSLQQLYNVLDAGQSLAQPMSTSRLRDFVWRCEPAAARRVARQHTFPGAFLDAVDQFPDTSSICVDATGGNTAAQLAVSPIQRVCVVLCFVRDECANADV
jgi:hypothetical protein